MNKLKNLKIKKLIKFSLVPAMVIPSLAVISCGDEQKREPSIMEQWEQRAANHQANMWIDGYIDKYSDDMYATSSVSDKLLNLSDIHRNNNKYWWLPHKDPSNTTLTSMQNYQNAIKGDIDPVKYSKESLKNDFKFESSDLTNEIHAFIKNYLKFDFHSNILGFYEQENWKNVGNQTKENALIMNSDGEHRNSFGNVYPGIHLFDQKGLSNYQKSVNDKSNYFNIRLIAFNQAMFHFNPLYAVLDPFYKLGTFMNEDYQYNLKSDYITNHKNMMEQIFDRLKSNKNYNLYHNQFLHSYHPDAAQPFVDLDWEHFDLNWYGALKIMMENLDLKPSEVIEVVSSSFTKIDAMRKSMLVKKLNDLNMNVYIDGSSDDSDRDLESISLEPSILNNVKRIYIQAPIVSKALPQTGPVGWLGRYYGRGQDTSEFHDADSIKYIRNYLRLKYGLIERLQYVIDNSVPNILGKVRIKIANSSDGYGYMTKYETDFYDNNKLNVKWVNSYNEFTKEEYVSEVLGITDTNSFLSAKPSYTANSTRRTTWISEKHRIKFLFDRNVH